MALVTVTTETTVDGGAWGGEQADGRVSSSQSSEVPRTVSWTNIRQRNLRTGCGVKTDPQRKNRQSNKCHQATGQPRSNRK